MNEREYRAITSAIRQTYELYDNRISDISNVDISIGGRAAVDNIAFDIAYKLKIVDRDFNREQFLSDCLPDYNFIKG